MKQIVMTGKGSYVITDRDYLLAASEYGKGGIQFWMKVMREHNGKSLTDPITDKELWDNRTHGDIAFPTQYVRIDMTRRHARRVSFVSGHGGKQPALLSAIRSYIPLECSHFKKGKITYRVSTGDAEAFMLGYISFDDMEKTIETKKDIKKYFEICEK